MSRARTITRRSLLVGAAFLGGALAVGFYEYRKPWPNPLKRQLAEGEATFNPYLIIAADNSIKIFTGRAEMGQGVSTTLAALVAEELDVDLEQISVEHGPASPAYYNIAALDESVPFRLFGDGAIAKAVEGSVEIAGTLLGIQATGGSSSVRDGFDKMRKAGATARAILIAAAARRFGVPVEEISTARGVLSHPASGRSVQYGDVALDAASVLGPENPPLRDKSEWRLLGKPQKRVDLPAKVTGAPIFGIDVRLPEMLYGTVRMSPRLGGKPARADISKAGSMPGVVKIVPLETTYGSGFGIIAENSWAAFRAAEAIDVEWEVAHYPSDSAAIEEKLVGALNSGSGTNFLNKGNVDVAFADAAPERTLEAEYFYPYLAHACMEPMNTTARFHDGKLDIWSPNQMPSITRWLCASIAGVSQDDVNLAVTSLGGGFGRRLEVDFAVYATLIAMQADGRPVNAVWTREEDIAHDFYRPAALGRFRARLGDDGLPVAVEMRIASQSVTKHTVNRLLPWVPVIIPDKLIVDGAWDQPYAIPDHRVTAVETEIGVPVASWRSVGASGNGFFHECFMDEIAFAGAIDPIELRRKLMAGNPAALSVVERLRDVSEWNKPLPDGRARGFAFTASFGSFVGEVVEVAGTPDGIRIEKVWIVADVGTALDPGIIEAQLVSGAIFGLSAAMNQEITFADGMVEQSNFHDFDALRMNQCPQFEVVILENRPEIGGVGEIGTPPAAPALANAIFALTGRRIRRLPLSREVSFA